MIETLSFITPMHLAMVPIVVGLVGAVKGFVKISSEGQATSRWVPVASILFGIGLAALLGGGVVAVVIGGIVIGLSACGLYSGSVAIKNG